MRVSGYDDLLNRETRDRFIREAMRKVWPTVTLGDKINSGGYGVVYRATITTTRETVSRDCAVKVICIPHEEDIKKAQENRIPSEKLSEYFEKLENEVYQSYVEIIIQNIRTYLST